MWNNIILNIVEIISAFYFNYVSILYVCIVDFASDKVLINEFYY